MSSVVLVVSFGLEVFKFWIAQYYFKDILVNLKMGIDTDLELIKQRCYDIEEKLKVKGTIEIFKKDKVSPYDCAVLVFKEL